MGFCIPALILTGSWQGLGGEGMGDGGLPTPRHVQILGRVLLGAWGDPPGKVPGAGTESKGAGEAHKWGRGTCCVCTGSEEDMLRQGRSNSARGKGSPLENQHKSFLPA